MNCPNCQSESVVPIIYGKPGPELCALADRNEVKLGGCIAMPDGDNRHCLDCLHRWLDKTDEDYLQRLALLEKWAANRRNRDR